MRAKLSSGYHGSPQVFYFTPHQKWYLIYQLEDSSREIAFGPCYSTTDDINDPASWSVPTPLYSKKPANLQGWLDFWVIFMLIGCGV
ncbi:MAG: non-reducing end alpha-L-arabinofuranosidase family hydrolase [Planctomycetaceae bacterium]